VSFEPLRSASVSSRRLTKAGNGPREPTSDFPNRKLGGAQPGRFRSAMRCVSAAEVARCRECLVPVWSRPACASSAGQAGSSAAALAILPARAGPSSSCR
jgi:hypothetical protein